MPVNVMGAQANRCCTAYRLKDGNCNNADEEVTYQYQAPGPQNCPSGMGDIVRTANGASDVITMCNIPSGSFTLAYYANNSSTAMSPVVLASVHRIKVTFTAQSLKSDTPFGGAMSVTLSSNIVLLNLGL